MTEKEGPRGRSALDDLKIVDPGALQGDPFARKSGVLSSLRASGRGWVAAAIAVVLVLAWRFSAPVSQQVAGTAGGGTAATSPGAPATSTGAPATPGTVRVAPDSAAARPAAAVASGAAVTRPIQLQSPNPTELKARIVEDFRSAGIEAIGYDRLDLSGVDAKLPNPLPAPVQAVLNRHGIPLPADGIVRVEIAQSR